MNKGVIYKITNLITKKMYVGKTSADPERYWERHKTLARGDYVDKYLYKSMRKHGVENFTFEIIDTYESSNLEEFNDELNSKEVYYIDKLQTKTPNGYNLTDGGEGTVGLKMSDETKAKLSASAKGRPSPRKGVTLSDETKKKLSEARMGRFTGEDNPFYGKKHTEETKEIIRKKNTEYQNRPDVKLANKLKQPNRIPVEMYSKDGELLETFISLTDAKRWIASNTKYKGDVSTISKAVDKGNMSYRYLWKRQDERTRKV